MNELYAWAAGQAWRERSIVRLEDALLANRFARYFIHRLRFFVARTAVSTVIHAAKIVLLLGAFPRSEFVIIVILQAGAALVGDFWWGALEQMRARIRLFQRRGGRHRIPREIGGWLAMAGGLALVGPFAGGVYVLDRLVSGDFGAVDAYVLAVLIGVSLDLIARTYHSGAYALRRVYRPLPSLLALDVVSVGALLVLWPVIGIWAFPAAELLSIVTVVSIALIYTSRTYRTLALPTLVQLFRLRARLPSLRVLRSAFAPGIAYALVGLEALVVIAGIATATTRSGSTLVVLLAALAPLSRASFEWARLLYFDLKRTELPLLASLRGRFDRAIVRLAVVIGVATGTLACVMALLVVNAATPLLIGSLLLLFVIRSLLAAAQMQAFTRSAYLRLAIAGAVGVAGVLLAFSLVPDAEPRMLGVSMALALTLLLLISLPPPRDAGEVVIPLVEWLRQLRRFGRPAVVAKLFFDRRLSNQGTTIEVRRAEEWRRDTVARRAATGLLPLGGAAAWVGAHELWLFEPAPKDGRLHFLHDRELVGLSAGLVDRIPAMASHQDAELAALELAEMALVPEPGDGAGPAGGTSLANVHSVKGDFARRFPLGIAYDIRGPVPPPLAHMPSELRVEIYRAALVFARDLRRGRGPAGWDVTSLVDDGALRVIFVVDQRENASARRAWRHLVRSWTIRAAAGQPVAAAQKKSLSSATGVDENAQEVAML